jgi:hypothetical protein
MMQVDSNILSFKCKSVPNENPMAMVHTQESSSIKELTKQHDNNRAKEVDPAVVAKARLQETATTVLSSKDSRADKAKAPPEAHKNDSVANLPKVSIVDKELDPAKSIPQLIKEGKLVDKTSQSGNIESAGTKSTASSKGEVITTPERQLVTRDTNTASDKGEPLPVRVVAEGVLKPDERAKVNFTVKGDGTIEVNNSPQKGRPKEIVIAVEQEPPTAAQKESTTRLLTYLSQAVAPPKAGGLLDISGDQSLVPQETLKKLDSAHVATQKTFDAQTAESISKVNQQFSSHSPRVMTQSDVRDYIPQRGVPARADEGDPILDTKDAIAGLYKGDYNTARSGADGWTVGRYGLRAELIMDWLSNLLKSNPELAARLGNPPDPKKLAELMKDPKFAQQFSSEMEKLAAEGKVTKDFADKLSRPEFVQQFAEFLGRMGDPATKITSADVAKFLPKELQETIAAEELKAFARVSSNPLETALAFRLGHKPTNSDLQDPANQQYMLAASKLMQMSQASRNAGENGTVVFTGDNSPASSMAAKLVQASRDVANSMNSVGYCAKGVQEALAKAGLGEFVGSGNGWDMRHAFDKDPRFQVIPASQARPGDICVQRWAPEIVAQHGGNNWGDVFIVDSVENGQITQNNDHVQKFNLSSRYDKQIFYRYVG